MGCFFETTLKYKVKQVNNMADFSRRSNLIEDDFQPKNKGSEKKGKSLVEALLGDSENFKVVAERFNLDPDMSEKIVVPLLSLLDKYGIGESLTSNPQLESASSTIEIIRDVAPVVKGAAEFISGRRAELEADDLAFLEKIKQSQEAGDASLFSSDDEEGLFSIGESVSTTPAAPQKPAPNFNAFEKNDWGNFWADATGASQQKSFLDNDLTRQMEAQQSALDQWASEQLGGGMKREKAGPHTTQTQGIGGDFNLGEGAFKDTFTAGQSTSFGLVDINQLAQEAGLSVSEVMDSDSQMQMVEKETTMEDFSIDMSAFEEEKEPIDYTNFEVPEEAESFDPFSIDGYEVPDLKVDLEEFQEYLPEVFDDSSED